MVGRVSRLDPVFKADLPIRESQIIQEAPDRLRVLYVPARGFTAEVESSITDRLRERVGPMRIVMEQVDAIPRTRNGKFRAVVSALPPDSRPPHAPRGLVR